ncbi:hypothetical protein E4656_00225 [Natronospirillum operosum]|uniref:Uncharacterized protein n=1 Tax=Natronospirillum operosum TaxID=2759953 RepID=A0A4Z0WAZ2_9GAMM|nr:hypothetical protein [Natronospirillum operosum]TGG94894.1 hypothetical protein E4656_00225 [Natronospirillum operosum]
MTQQQTPDVPKKSWLGFLDRTSVPIAVYGVIAVTMVLLWIFQELHPDVTLGFFTELLGAAFTLFIIDTLLVRSKTKRWRVVQTHVDYLVARDVNRLRDGLAVRVFGFDPVIAEGSSDDQVAAVRAQRAALLTEMEAVPLDKLAEAFATESLFTESSYAYLDGKARALWDVLNMRYSEYMDPELVSTLMRLHTHLKDLCGHIRHYGRGASFVDDADYYETVGIRGASVSVRNILQLVNELKRQGYSRPASMTAAQ